MLVSKAYLHSRFSLLSMKIKHAHDIECETTDTIFLLKKLNDFVLLTLSS